MRLNKTGLRIIFGLLFLILIAGTSLTACNTTPSTNTAAKIIPADAKGFISLALSPSINQKLALLELSKHFPAGVHSENKDQVVNKFIDELVKDSDLTYDKDLKPWLGGEVAATVLQPAENSTKLVVVGLVKVKNEKKAQATLDKKNVNKNSYRFIGGYLVMTSPDDAEDNQLHADNKLQADKAFDAIEQVAKGKVNSLNKNKRYKEALSSMNDQHLALGWLDFPALVNSLGDEVNRRDSAALNKELSKKVDDSLTSVKDVGAFSFALYAAGSSVVFEGMTEKQSKHKLSTVNGDILAHLPTGTLAAVDIPDISDVLKTGVDALGNDGNALTAELTTPLGKLASSLKGDSVVLVGAEKTISNFKFGIISETNDPATAQAAINNLVGVLENEGLVVTTTNISGGTANTIGFLPTDINLDANINSGAQYPRFSEIVIALSGNRLIISTDLAYVTQIATSLTGPAKNSSLGSTDQMLTSQAFVDLGGVVNLIKNDPTGNWGVNKKDKQGEEWAESIDVLSSKSWTKDNHEHFEIRLAFK